MKTIKSVNQLPLFPLHSKCNFGTYFFAVSECLGFIALARRTLCKKTHGVSTHESFNSPAFKIMGLVRLRMMNIHKDRCRLSCAANHQIRTPPPTIYEE